MRTPHADTSLYWMPSRGDEGALTMLTDIIPTAFECGVLNGKVQPGSSDPIVGAGHSGAESPGTSRSAEPGSKKIRARFLAAYVVGIRLDGPLGSAQKRRQFGTRSIGALKASSRSQDIAVVALNLEVRNTVTDVNNRHSYKCRSLESGSNLSVRE